jgi:hypothetical protein
METIDLFQIIGSISGLIALALHWKKMKKEEPKIIFHITKCFYYVENLKKKVLLHIVLDTLFENKGNASGSITDVIMRIRYSYDAIIDYPSLINKYVISSRPINFDNLLPLEIGPYGSKKVRLLFTFKGVFPLLLERCGVSIDLKNPKKWEWKDLPIRFQLTINHTNGLITKDYCVFRKDLQESKKIRGSIDILDEFKLDWKFVPRPGE